MISFEKCVYLSMYDCSHGTFLPCVQACKSLYTKCKIDPLIEFWSEEKSDIRLKIFIRGLNDGFFQRENLTRADILRGKIRLGSKKNPTRSDIRPKIRPWNTGLRQYLTSNGVI